MPDTSTEDSRTNRKWYTRRSIHSPVLRLGLAIVALMVGGTVGLLVGIIVGVILMEVTNASDFEGGSGYGVVVIGATFMQLVGWGSFLYVLLYWTRNAGWGIRRG